MEKLKNRTAYNIATLFGLGRLPYAPGTWGSIAGLLFSLMLHPYTILYIIFFLIFFTLGVASSGVVSDSEDKQDPQFVVIDEFACVFVVFLFIQLTPARVITGFCLYRIFDIFKVPPARGAETIKGGWGIMLDDLIAGVYSNLALHIISIIGII